MPSGKVMIYAPLLGDTTGYGGDGTYGGAKLFDNDYTTLWASPGQGGYWVAVDLGAGNSSVLSEFRFTPRAGDGFFEYESTTYSSKIEASNDPTFATGVVTLYTIPGTYNDNTSQFPFIPRNQVNRFPISNTTAYRCYRLKEPDSSYGEIAEFRLIVSAPAGTASTQPVPPDLSIWGGRFPNRSSVQTNVSSQTTSASIYYTLDGTTPTNSSIQSDGTINVPLVKNGTVTLKVISYDATCTKPTSDVITAFFSGYGIKVRDDWYDDKGNLIEAHSGKLFDDRSRTGKYFWYGQFMNLPNTGRDLRFYPGVWCYSSTDMLNWKIVGNILPAPTGWLYVLRPHVIYNASTSKYVLWAHLDNTGDSTDRAGIATADNPQGPWTWVNTSLNPDGQGFKDCSLFQDLDGTAYTVYTVGTQNGVNVSRLASDYLSTSGTYTAISATNREAPQLFRRGSVYYLLTTLSNYYDSTTTFNAAYVTSTSALGPWPDLNTTNYNLFSTDPVGTDYNGQPAFVAKISGTSDQYFLGMDYFVQNNLFASRQVWLPLTFPTSNTMGVQTLAVWDPSQFAPSLESKTLVACFI